jgi:uncharacterized protein YecE (DUF72 family)
MAGRRAEGRRGGARVLAGTSGFSYAEWRGSFYPEKTPTRDMLPFYARAFATVEINHTFHRLPTAALLTGWARQVPAGFRFALKAPQRITHQLRLREAEEITATFCALARGLGAKLGPLLFQLPPYLRFDAARLEGFLRTLPSGIEPAFEFRSADWFNDETYALLSKHRAALCVADAEALTTPFVPTAPFGYLRLRREDYTPSDVAAWAERVGTTARWKRAYVYFKHEAAGRGPALARDFLSRLGDGEAKRP